MTLAEVKTICKNNSIRDVAKFIRCNLDEETITDAERDKLAAEYAKELADERARRQAKPASSEAGKTEQGTDSANNPAPAPNEIDKPTIRRRDVK